VTFSDVVEAAERAVEDGITAPDLDTLAHQVDGLDLTKPWEEEEQTRLAVLLDYLGLHVQAERVLRGAGQSQASKPAGLRNMEGMLAAHHGDYGRAVALFAEALPTAPQGSLIRTRILANLAAACLQAGETAQATEWLVQASQARLLAGDPAVDVLLTSVQVAVAAAECDPAHLRTSVLALGEASRSRIAELGPHHPQSLMTAASMAAAEFQLACAEGSPERQERAVRVLETATRRLAAELGANHPQALASLANLRTADLVIARRDGRMQRIAAAEAELESVSRNLAAISGTDHSQARAAAGSEADGRTDVAGSIITAEGSPPRSDAGEAGTIASGSPAAGVVAPVSNLVMHVSGADAIISWTWPDNAESAQVSWFKDDTTSTVTVRVAQYRSDGGVRIPLGNSRTVVDVRAVIWVDGAPFASPPAQVAIDPVRRAIEPMQEAVESQRQAAVSPALAHEADIRAAGSPRELVRYTSTSTGIEVRPALKLHFSEANVPGNLGRILGEVILYRIEARRAQERLYEIQTPTSVAHRVIDAHTRKRLSELTLRAEALDRELWKASQSLQQQTLGRMIEGLQALNEQMRKMGNRPNATWERRLAYEAQRELMQLLAEFTTVATSANANAVTRILTRPSSDLLFKLRALA